MRARRCAGSATPKVDSDSPGVPSRNGSSRSSGQLERVPYQVRGLSRHSANMEKPSLSPCRRETPIAQQTRMVRKTGCGFLIMFGRGR